jgi:hypothetical protein
MNDNRQLPRRQVLGMAVASGLTLLTAPLRSIAQQVTRRTPAQIHAVPGDAEKALSASWDVVLHDG